MKRQLVAVVDDDESVRESVPDLLRTFGLEARPFSSAEEFLASDSLEPTGCLVLDVAMPGMSGPELQRELARRRADVGVVFITARADEQVQAQVLQQGASAFLLKPFSEAAIVEAVNAALGYR
jgi:FixJ family two-component response regulator